MSENSPAPITLEEQIGYCKEEAARWQHFKAKARTAARWAEAKVRHDYYQAIAASLRFLRDRHDLATTQEIKPVEVTNGK
jgi:hypothetical protein